MARGGLLGAKVAGVPVPVVIVGGVAVGYLLYSHYRNKGTATAAPAAASSGSGSSRTTDQETAAAVYQVGQQQAQGLATLEQQIASMFPAPGPAPTPTPTGSTSPSAPQVTAGYGVVQTAKGPMIWLGNWGAPHFQVGGGAPVFFGNAEALNEGPQAEVPGADIYTPVAYAGLISSAPS